MATTATYPLLPAVGAPTPQGGEVPRSPFVEDRRQSIKRAPTKDEILDLLKRVTEPSYHTPIIDDPRGSIAVYRAMACEAAVVAQKAFRSQQSLFILTYPTQGEPPASSLNRATMTVNLTRTRDRDQGRIAEIGSIILFGPQGRTYINSEQAEWVPFDSSDDKPVEFVSENPGYVGNLEHLADANGLLTDQDGTPSTGIVGLVVQSGQSNDLASIVAVPGSNSQLADDGTPDVFSENMVGLYVEITAATTAANVGRILKIVGYEQPGVEDPSGGGLFPRRIQVDDGPIRTQIFSVQADDGGVFTDETAAARSNTIDDITLLPVAPATGDAYYFGAGTTFPQVELTISQAGVGVWTLTWEYYDGTSFVAIPGVVDSTVGFTGAGINTVSFAIPGDWTTTAVNSVTAFWVRARVSAFASITTQPLGSIAYTFNSTPLTPEAGSVSWIIRDWIDLFFEITRIEAPTGGTDDMLRMLGEERGVFQARNEADDDFRQRVARLTDVVSPNAINRVLNRALFPFNLLGEAVDVGSGFDGWFWDVDAWDYYETPFLTSAQADDGGAFTDETTESQDDTVDDMTLLPATVAASDSYYFGQSEAFSQLTLDISTVGVGDWTIEWRYWNGATFTALSGVVDGTNGFRNLGARVVTFTVPGDWASTTVNGVAAFYIQAFVTAVTTTTTQPLGRIARTEFAFPVSDRKLLLSTSEAFGWFFVYVPNLPSDLDFGFAWDIDGPFSLINGVRYAGAWDTMFWDGEPTDANAAYAGIYDQIDTIRMGGVGFSMLIDTDLNTPRCP